MKKYLTLLAIALISSCAIGQTLSSPFMSKATKVAPTVFIDTLMIKDTLFLPSLAPTPFVSKTAIILLLTPSIPVNFSRLQQVNGSWQIAGSITTGLAYSFVVGQGTTLSNGSTEVVPYISIGAYVDAGGMQNLISKGIIGSASIGGTLGLYKYVGILVAYDVVNKVPIFGLGASVSIISFTSGKGGILLNPKHFN
jgi:hypothetical protein